MNWTISSSTIGYSFQRPQAMPITSPAPKIPLPPHHQSEPQAIRRAPIPKVRRIRTAPLRKAGHGVFAPFAEEWLENHKAYIQPSTFRVYSQYVGSLLNFLGKEILIADVGIDSIRDYQRWRSQVACPTRVNAEVSALRMILDEADCWRPIARVYRQLPVPKRKVRQNMTPAEEARLYEVILNSPPRRLLAGHCLVVMWNTSMGFGELRHLKREDVVLNEDIPVVTVNEGTKNDYRIRTIPLNRVALRSMRWLVRRWEKLGGTESGQYLLPHHTRRSAEERQAKGHARKSPPIFDEPMGHIYNAVRSILKEAELSHLKPYDMRSHAITRMLANPKVSDQTYEELAGHVGKQMRRRYSRQQLETKQVATDAICAPLLESQTEPSGAD